MNKKIISGVKDYYTDKIKQHGTSSQGVDWNSEASQFLRFEQLCKIIQPDTPFQLLDYGCGYAALIQFLNAHYEKSAFKYTGYDISEEMLAQARLLFPASESTVFTASIPEQQHDYLIASGLFNVRLELANDTEWKDYILQTLNQFNDLSSKGFSFNALTSYSDKEYMKDYLYYADPLFFFDYCKKNFSRNIALLHDYNLYEFTILVRK